MGIGWQISESEAAQRDRALASQFFADIQPLLDRPIPAIRAELQARRYSPRELARLLVILRQLADSDPAICACVLEIDLRIGDQSNVSS